VKEIRFEHRHGHITVTESDSQQIELEIRYFDREEESQPVCEILAGTVLRIKTVLPEDVNTSWSLFNRKNRNKQSNERLGIDYIIAVPRNVAMNVNLKYGNLIMGDFYSDFTANVDYGRLIANTFHKSPVSISSKYSNVELEQAGVLNISIDYANLEARTINTLNFQTKYGKHRIGKIINADINCSYGNIDIDSVNTLKFQVKYGNHRIGKIVDADINCSYGNISIDLVNTLKLQVKYGNYRIDKTKNVELDGSYGNVKIESVDEIDAELFYTPTNIENLKKKLNAKCQYSNVRVSDCSKQLETIKFSGKYSGLTLGFDTDLSAELNVDLTYGNLSVNDDYQVKYSFSEKDYNKTVKKGIIGSKTPTAKIDISNSYANVSIR
jgi:hypothetical protein